MAPPNNVFVVVVEHPGNGGYFFISRHCSHAVQRSDKVEFRSKRKSAISTTRFCFFNSSVAESSRITVRNSKRSVQLCCWFLLACDHVSCFRVDVWNRRYHGSFWIFVLRLRTYMRRYRVRIRKTEQTRAVQSPRPLSVVSFGLARTWYDFESYGKTISERGKRNGRTTYFRGIRKKCRKNIVAIEYALCTRALWLTSAADFIPSCLRPATRSHSTRFDRFSRG